MVAQAIALFSWADEFINNQSINQQSVCLQAH
jgi:hypothetical protein